MEKSSRLKAPSDTDVSGLLRAWSDGDQNALQALTPIVYAELHRLARHYMRRERSGHSLQATALVNEAYMRLADYTRMQWQDRAHFFAVSAQVMRQILIDHARVKFAQKRGGRQEKLSLDEAQEACVEDSAVMVRVDDALKQLERLDARKARLVEMRFFGGMTAEETAEALGLSVHVVRHDLRFAQAWLRRKLNSVENPSNL